MRGALIACLMAVALAGDSIPAQDTCITDSACERAWGMDADGQPLDHSQMQLDEVRRAWND